MLSLEKTNHNPSKVMNTCATHKHFTSQHQIEPFHWAVFEALLVQPKVRERKSIFARVVGKVLALVKTFDEGLGGVVGVRPSTFLLPM